VKIHFKDLIGNLNAYATFELSFIKHLLKKATKSEKPHKNPYFARQIDCAYNKKWNVATAIMGWLYGKSIPCSKLAKIVELARIPWRDVEKNLVSLRAGQNRGEVNIQFPIFVDEKLGSIVGHILGDGSIDSKYRQVFFTNSNMELAKEFAYAMNATFEIDPRIWLQTRNGFKKQNNWINRTYLIPNETQHQIGLFYPSICGDILHSIFGIFAKGKKKKITPQIHKTPKSFKRGLLRAFFDDEGSVNVQSQQISICQDNPKIIEEIKKLLLDFDIKSNSLHFHIKCHKRRYYFRVTHVINHHRFYHSIGFTSSKL